MEAFVNSGNFHGFLDQYANVAETFTAILEERPFSGASLSIWKDGVCVVNLHGGFADHSLGITWEEDTPSVIFSSTKGVMSLLLAKLFQDRSFDYLDPVGKYWPEFAHGAKKNILIRDLVSHRAGLPVIQGGVTLDQVIDWDYMVDRLAKEEPLWTPGSNYFYHAITHGWLTGELVTRLTGLTPGEYLQIVASKPLKLDFWIGAPAEVTDRAANLYVTESLKSLFSEIKSSDTQSGNLLLSALTLGGAFPDVLVGEGTGFNSRDVQGAQSPGAGGIATAHSLAKLWSSAVVETDGLRLLSDETISVVSQPQSEGVPFGEGPPPYSRFGMGFQLDSEARKYLTPKSFGHDGAGGQCAFADPVHKIGFAFLTNEMDGAIDTRATTLIDELGKSLKA